MINNIKKLNIEYKLSYYIILKNVQISNQIIYIKETFQEIQ